MSPSSVPAPRALLPWLLGGLLMLLLVLLTVALSKPRPGSLSEQSLALLDARNGDSWYRVDIHDQPAGYARLSTNAATLELATHLRFQLASGTRQQWQQLTETLRFAKTPPHRLEHLQVVRSEGPFTEQINLDLVGSRYQATIQQRGSSRSHWLQLDYVLADHLALEHWLASAPAAGARRTVPSLDTATLQVSSRQWQLAGSFADGWLLSGDNNSGTLMLDQQLLPKVMTLGSGLALHRSSRKQALAVPNLPLRERLQPGSTAPFALLQAGLDQPLGSASDIIRLELDLNAAAGAAFAAGPGQRSPQPGRLIIDRRLPDPPASADSLRAALAATPEYPLADPQVQSVAIRVMANHPLPGARIEVLTALVHETLAYDTTTNPLTVLDTLALRRGDCTEFAQLFTTLARASGLPTRTVTGLAYLGDHASAFAMHAWNEVWTGSRWQVVDPTWNQPHADATHLRFSDHADHFGIADMQFRVAAIERNLSAALGPAAASEGAD